MLSNWLSDQGSNQNFCFLRSKINIKDPVIDIVKLEHLKGVIERAPFTLWKSQMQMYG